MFYLGIIFEKRDLRIVGRWKYNTLKSLEHSYLSFIHAIILVENSRHWLIDLVVWGVAKLSSNKTEKAHASDFALINWAREKW